MSAADPDGRNAADSGGRNAQVDTVVDDLLARMSLREKAGQLNQRLFGWQCVRRNGRTWETTDLLHAEIERWGGLGALYGLFRADPWSGRSWADGIPPEERAEVAALVTDAVRRSAAHGVGPLIVEEAPHGHQALGGSLLPVPLNMAATWDPGLVEEAARAVGAELAASGVHLALVTALDVLRDPRWGRAEECLGESPELAARMAAALVRGMQGPDRNGLGRDGVGVVLKHFAAQGESMGGRNGQSAVIGEHDLRELHLPPARAGVRAGAVGVMAAYNDIDGVPCCANPWLLGDVLRGEWGFDGLVMSDGLAVDRLEAVTGSPREAARLALLSGVDLSLWDRAYTLLEEAADRDPAVAAAVDRACRRVLSVKRAVGLLPSPDGTAADPPERGRAVLSARRARTEEVSARLARRSLVLLHDDDTLPLGLREARRVLVVGPHAAEATALLGDYVPPLPPGSALSVLDAVRTGMSGHARLDHVPRLEPDGGSWDRAAVRTAAAAADLVVAVLGGTSHRDYRDRFTDVGAADLSAGSEGTRATSGEGVDLADLRLPGDQDALLAQVRAATRAPVAVVVVAGRPHVLTDVLASADAVLWAGFPGPHGADAVVDALTGRIPIRGRLPMTLPSVAGAVPVHHDDRHSPDGVYADAVRPVLRPFGWGAPAPGLRISAVDEAGRGTADHRIRVELRNAGGSPADDTVQLYTRRRDGVRLPRTRVLTAFAQVELAPGASRVVEFPWRGPSERTSVIAVTSVGELGVDLQADWERVRQLY
ncbi:glycoside hydrolase family 3 N-terminal domain-containing protein [Nocardiopsis synnemataformans]|uniref:glycoside hydrolase family 3 protein n=1 Tax=Nocardiopsis synnemataformans TaxID=61305 RepID=UPI003EB9DA8B